MISYSFPVPSGYTEPHELSGMSPDTPLLLGYSGGADSTALLHILAEYASRTGCKLYAAHVQHGIRGAEALRDQAFCKNEAEKLGITFLTADFDVPSLAKEHGSSLETEGRSVRYAWFEQLMEQYQIPILITAHHADDNLETILFRLIRGTGTHGLCGIAPSRPMPEQGSACERKIIRPLLQVSKADILQLCLTQHWEFVEDSTNFENDCSRNIIRNEIIPKLRTIYPAPERSVSHLATILREDDQALESIAEEKISSMILKSTPGSVTLSKSALESQHPSIRSRIIRMAFGMTELPTPEYSLLSSLSHGPLLPTQLDVPDNGIIRITEAEVQIGRHVCSEKLQLSEFALKEGLFEYPDFGFEIAVSSVEAPSRDHFSDNPSTCGLKIIYKFSTTAYISFDKIHTNTVTVFRSRKSGDRIMQGGMSHDIRKMLCDSHIPAEKRSCFPLLASGDNVLWIPLPGTPNGRVADGYTPLEGTKVFKITVFYNDSWQ